MYEYIIIDQQGATSHRQYWASVGVLWHVYSVMLQKVSQNFAVIWNVCI